jgi:hypothetical protein
MKSALGMALGAFAGFLGAVITIQSGLLPKAEAQAGGGAGATDGHTIVATGGSTNNQMDLCWVLTKVKPAKGKERTVLALYQAENQGKAFNLKDIRYIDPDLRLYELPGGRKQNPSIEQVFKALPEEEQRDLRGTP